MFTIYRLIEYNNKKLKAQYQL